MIDQRAVIEHYGRAGLGDVILAALKAAGKDIDHLTPDDLAPVDEFHHGGRAATAAFAPRLNLQPGMHLLEIGSGIAAELGSMVVTDQINALRALGTDPIRKLVVPRILAGFFMAPLLTIVADFVGIFGGWIVARFQLQVPTGLYWSSILKGLYVQDVWMGIIKPFALGFVIVTIACHVGLRTSGGTQGVGRATTVAVVAGSVAVIAVDFFVGQAIIKLLY